MFHRVSALAVSVVQRSAPARSCSNRRLSIDNVSLRICMYPAHHSTTPDGLQRCLATVPSLALADETARHAIIHDVERAPRRAATQPGSSILDSAAAPKGDRVVQAADGAGAPTMSVDLYRLTPLGTARRGPRCAAPARALALARGLTRDRVTRSLATSATLALRRSCGCTGRLSRRYGGELTALRSAGVRAALGPLAPVILKAKAIRTSSRTASRFTSQSGGRTCLHRAGPPAAPGSHHGILVVALGVAQTAAVSLAYFVLLLPLAPYPTRPRHMWNRNG